MKKYIIKRLNDNQITHIQYSSDSDYIPVIPTGWDLEDNYEVLEEVISEDSELYKSLIIYNV